MGSSGGMQRSLAVLGLCAAVLGTAGPAHAPPPPSFLVMADTPLSLAVLQRLAPMMERGGSLRVLPVAGKGPVQTLTDLASLHDVDAVLVSSDALGYMNRNGLVGGLADKLGFLVKLGGL